MRIGETKGLWWEVGSGTSADNSASGAPHLSDPAQADRWRQLREAFRRQIPGVGLPANLTQPGAVRRTRIVAGARGVLYFDSDWTAHVSPFASRWRNLLRASRRQNPVLAEALRPVLRRAGVAPRAPVTFLAVIVSFGFAGLAALIVGGPTKFKIEASLGFALGLAIVPARTISKKLIGVAGRHHPFNGNGKGHR